MRHSRGVERIFASAPERPTLVALLVSMRPNLLLARKAQNTILGMPPTVTELAGLHATVDRVLYMPEYEAPSDRPHPFAYFITIHNDSDATVTIKGRKWVVTDARGHRVVVEGEGVVGKYPRLEPGQSFSYDSFHVIGSDSLAEGAFFGLTEHGDAVFTRIPPFQMQTPRVG